MKEVLMRARARMSICFLSWKINYERGVDARARARARKNAARTVGLVALLRRALARVLRAASVGGRARGGARAVNLALVAAGLRVGSGALERVVAVGAA